MDDPKENPSSLLMEARNIVHIYGHGSNSVVALNQISLSLVPGELIILSGISGSGKTTLLNILGCLERPLYGELFFDGTDTATLSQDALAKLRSQHIGFVFQQSTLLSKLTALENVLLPVQLAGESPNIEKGKELLSTFGLTSRAHHYPSELSGGEQQRVAIARALIRDPQLILADEPTANLDSKTGGNTLSLLCNLTTSRRTVIIATHHPETIKHYDQAIVLLDGCLLAA